ncbi:MAG: Tm-1-like ATP-binding domain-containing protein [Verrucomicrobia bacterium]|nr:Tm-1-like ATP-binding domain-containing protein [Verrucomicrobiota bacterium]
MPTIAILGTFDSKGPEHAFLAEAIRARGFATLLINAGCLGEPGLAPDIPSNELAAAGDPAWREILARRDRGECVALMTRGAAAVVARLATEKKISGIVSLGGGGGTAIATAAMRALPIGFPKLMVSTLASGQVAPYVGTADITMMPAIVDVSGLNRVSRVIFENAAGAICGMVTAAETRAATVGTALRAVRPVGETTGAAADGSESRPDLPDKPLIVASMFGNTTACVTDAKKILEAAGYEVLVFAATGNGGRAMESLIASGLVAGVLDITTTEWADELVGGVLTAGPERLDATAKAKIPAIVTPGCLDMVNFGEPSTVPAKFAGRTFYQHNAQVTLMRTTPAECTELGRIIAERLNRYTAPVTVLLPLRAISVISAPGKPFHSPEADAALFASLKKHLRPAIPVREFDVEINDPTFAHACAEALLASLARR